MTDEDGAPRFLFVETIEPLPLVDPTIAAQFLDVERHTLACYRNLGGGPAYYKFGRWIRYAEADLRAWKKESGQGGAVISTFELFTAHGSAPDLLDSMTAARFLTVTRQCLSNYRGSGLGPPYRNFGRRLYYSNTDLLRWAAMQRHSAGMPQQVSGNKQGTMVGAAEYRRDWRRPQGGRARGQGLLPSAGGI